MIRRCMQCASLVQLRDSDLDTPALCGLCVDDVAQDVAAASDWNRQAGAQFIGRELGTRDDRSAER